MTEQLKPCPFCGSADLSVISIDYKCYAVECNNCGAIGRFKETKDDAISAWNSRLNESTKHINEIKAQGIEEAIKKADGETYIYPIGTDALNQQYRAELKCYAETLRAKYEKEI